MPAVIRPGGRPAGPDANAGGSFTRSSYRNFLFEISLNDFGLEESYGRFIKEKIYVGDTPDLSGSLVDLYV